MSRLPAMRTLHLLTVLLLAAGCGSDRRATPSSGGEGEGEGEGPAEGEGEGPSEGESEDPVRALDAVDVAEGVTALQLGEDGETIETCEGGEPKRRARELLGPSGSPPSACPAAPTGVVERDGKTLRALGAAGLDWAGTDVTTKGPSFDVAFVGDGDRWAITAAWDGLRLWDLGEDPAVPVASERPDVGAITGVVSDGAGTVFAFGPAGLARLEVRPELSAPDIGTSLPQVTIGEAGESSILLWNHGNAPLHVTAVSADRDDLTATVEAWGEEPPEGVLALAAPGQNAMLTVVLEGGAPGGPIDGTVEVRSNDPDEPVLRVPVEAGHPALVEGNTAPDFTLPDLEGRPHTLSDYRGKVVHLMLFNALCVSCGEALPWLESDVWGPLAGQDFQPLILHVGPDTHVGLRTLEESGNTAPMLLDIDGSVNDDWTQVYERGILFPLNYLVDKGGLVHKVSTEEAVHEPWTTWIEEIL